MGNEYFDLNIRVKATSEDAALELVKKQLGDVAAKAKDAGDAAKGAEGPMSKFGGALKSLAVAAGVTLGLAEVVRLIKDGAKEAIADERALGALVVMLGMFDKTLVGAKEKAEKFGESMKQVGMDDGEVYVGLRQLIPITGNYENAVKGVSLAWNLHIATGEQYATMLDLVAGLVANKPRSLVQAQMLLGEKFKTTQEALDTLSSRFGDFASKIDDQQMKVDKLATKWHDLWKKVGGESAAAILDGIELAGKLGDKLQAVVDRIMKGKTSGDSAFSGDKARKDAMQFHEDSIAYFEKELAKVEKGSDKWHEYTKAIAENVDEWRKLRDSAEGDLPGGPPKSNPPPPEDKPAVNNGEMDSAQKLADAYRDLATAEAEEARQKMLSASTSERADAAFGDAYRKRIAQADFEQRSLQTSYQKDVTQDGLSLKAKDKLHDKYVVDVMKSEGKLKTDLTKLGDDLLKVYAKDAKDRETLHEQALKRMEADELEAERKRQTNSKKFDDLHKKQELSARAGELKAMRQELITELMDLRTSEQRKHEILKQFAQLNTEIAEEESKAKRDLYLQTAADSLMAASQAFGDNKALAIASTIISTYKSAQESYESLASIPYVGVALGIAAAAAAIAAGMARVSQIQSASPPGAAKGAYLSGATNLIAGEAGDELVLPSKYTRMFDRMADREARVSNSTTIHNRQRGGDTIVNQTLLTGAHADYAFRQLDRKLLNARRQNDRAMLMPPVTRIGSKRRVP